MWNQKPRASRTQGWHKGNVVRCGFVNDLEVIGVERDPDARDGNRIVYRLRKVSNGVRYTFVPHEGLSRD